MKIIEVFVRLAAVFVLSNRLEAIKTSVPVNSKQNVGAAETAFPAVFRVSGDFDA
jgi:hypothetical protein